MASPQIVLDTNVLLYAAKNKVDLVGLIKEKLGIYTIYAPTNVIEELKHIKATQKRTLREQASVALDIIHLKRLQKLELAGPVDDSIAEWAAKNKGAILTNDVELKFKLRDMGVKVYNIRQGKYIVEW
jgi:rRNA-processing protein FCF1